MNASSRDDAFLFQALAQPVLRGPGGRAFSVAPGAGGAAVAARPWPCDGQGCTVRAWAHASPGDGVPWLATQGRVLALVDGHRPLTVAPATPWGHDGAPPDAPYPAAVSAQVGGLTVFFVNAARQVRVFAADAAQAVELPPVDDAQIYAAWQTAGQLWTAGMAPRPRDADGDVSGWGQALLLRWHTRPLAVAARWQGRDLWPVDEAAAPAKNWADVLGAEAWLADLPGASGSARWLLGAPLTRGLHDAAPDASPLWALGLPAPDDYGALLLARLQDDAGGEGASPPPLALSSVLPGHSFIGRCRASGSHALVFTLHRGGAQAAWPGQLHVSQWDGAAGRLGAPQPMRLHALPPLAQAAALRDLDAVHHPAFGYAATLTWQPPRAGSQGPWPAPSGALLHSPDGRHWQMVQALAADDGG